METQPLKGNRAKSIIIFDTRFGNTGKIATSLEKGLKRTGIETTCKNVGEVDPGTLKDYDLICLGAPTEAFSSSKPMKEFFTKLNNYDLSGKYGFAFDTKISSRLSGSAAKYMENRFNNLKLHPTVQRESAVVSSIREGGKIVGAKLKDGEEERFEQIGLQVGTAFFASKRWMVTA